MRENEPKKHPPEAIAEPERPAQTPLPAAAERESAVPPAGDVPPSDEDRRPTPVRMAMEGQENPEEDSQKKNRVIFDEDSGSDWVVSVGGRSTSGILPLRTVPLMELLFSHPEATDQPLRRSLRYGEDLADLTDDDLLATLRESEPFLAPTNKKGEPKKGNGNRKNRRSRSG